jgi:predicted acetyltransferase
MEIKQASAQDREIVENLMQIYLHDLSQFDGSLPNSRGKFDCGEHFPLYWTEPDRYPYLFSEHGAVVGFALVRRLGFDVYAVAEFFVLRAYRGKGIARSCAKALFELHRGTWQVAELEENIPAQEFWRSTIREYTQGNFSEGRSDSSPRGPMQTFCNAAKQKTARYLAIMIKS